MEAEGEDTGYQAVKRMADKSSNDKHYQAIKESSHFWLEWKTGQGIFKDFSQRKYQLRNHLCDSYSRGNGKLFNCSDDFFIH